MGKSILLFVLLVVIFECNGHLSTITDILGGVHKQVHSTVQGVANTFLGGFDFNVGAQFGLNNQGHRPPPQQQNGGDETVIVVVDETNKPGYGHGNGHYNNYNNPYGQGHNNQNGNYNPNFNQNNQGRPHYNQGQPYQNNYGQNYGYPNQNYNGQPMQPNPHNNGPSNQNNYGNPNQNYNQNNYDNPNPSNNGPPNQNNNNIRPNQNNYEQPPPVTPTTEENKPTYGSINDSSGNKEQSDDDKRPNFGTTEKSDEPLFVPLNPNEYIYGGDKINITAPKRDTDKKVDPEEDAEADIDIRFQDQ